MAYPTTMTVQVLEHNEPKNKVAISKKDIHDTPPTKKKKTKQHLLKT